MGKQIHEGKLHVKGFVMTSKGLELEFEEQLKKPKTKQIVEPEINEHIEEKVIKEEHSSILLDDW